MTDIEDQWKDLGYSELSAMEHHLEFGIIEALLWEMVEVRYISGEGSDYPSLPRDEELASVMLNSARIAREIRSSFPWPEQESTEGFRSYVGRVADAFEAYSNELGLIPDPNTPEDQNGCIASDLFVVITMQNRTYEEDD